MRPTPDGSPVDSPEPGSATDDSTMKHTRGGVVLKEGREIAGFIIAEQEVRTLPLSALEPPRRQLRS